MSYTLISMHRNCDVTDRFFTPVQLTIKAGSLGMLQASRNSFCQEARPPRPATRRGRRQARRIKRQILAHLYPPSGYKWNVTAEKWECMLFRLLLQRSLCTGSLHLRLWSSFLSEKASEGTIVFVCGCVCVCLCVKLPISKHTGYKNQTSALFSTQ